MDKERLDEIEQMHDELVKSNWWTEDSIYGAEYIEDALSDLLAAEVPK